MRAIRLPLLCAFAGGCLSNALLFFLWRSPDSAGSPALEQHHARNVVALADTAAPSTPTSELDATRAAEDGAHAAAEPARSASPPSADNNAEAPPPAGSAVSDVLTSLEAAYRERVSARAPAEPPQTAEATTRATAANNLIAAPEPARSAATPSAADAPPPPPALEARATPPAPTAPSTPAAAAAVPPPMAAVASQAPPAPAFAAEDAPPPTQIHYGDINQNTYVTNIRQGDVYLIQLQQLAVLQYMQMLGASANVAPAARHPRGAPPQRAFPSGIINPDNPWGFHFTPPNLVR